MNVTTEDLVSFFPLHLLQFILYSNVRETCLVGIKRHLLEEDQKCKPQSNHW